MGGNTTNKVLESMKYASFLSHTVSLYNMMGCYGTVTYLSGNTNQQCDQACVTRQCKWWFGEEVWLCVYGQSEFHAE